MDDIVWPEAALSWTKVQRWIAGVLDLDPEMVTLSRMYRATTDFPGRLTARLRIEAGARPDMVLCWWELGSPGAGAADELVSQYAASLGLVPRVRVFALRKLKKNVETYLIRDAFDGEPVVTADAVCEAARSLARVQVAVAAADISHLRSASLLEIYARDLLPLFEMVLHTLEKYHPIWEADEQGELTRLLGFPGGEAIARLAALRSEVMGWINIVEAAKIPVSIDHGDLHTGNAVLLPDGRVLLFDWETATLGCPLFSLEKLVVSAWSVDAGSLNSGPWGYVAGTPTQARVCAAYREVFGGVLADADGAAILQAALCLAVIREMATEIHWALANTHIYPNGNPQWTAQLVHRLFQHRQGMRVYV